MAIRIPDIGTGSGAVGDGDNELKIRQDYNHNFRDQSNAASRLVGGAAGNVMLVGAGGILGSGYDVNMTTEQMVVALRAKGSTVFRNIAASTPVYKSFGIGLFASVGGNASGYTVSPFGEGIAFFSDRNNSQTTYELWTNKNATKDANGFLKGASPVIDMYDNKIDLNYDAEQQGGITFEKIGVGDYLIKGSLGFAQEGWYIEMPKDANGNVLVAVVYEQLANNDLSIKTYAKRFDDETGDIVANLLKPRDIPAGRFISLRLHELPKESPVMPMDEPTTEV